VGKSGDELRLVWQEDGGPAVDLPAVAGFGTTMLSQAIEYQHEGKVELDWLTGPLQRATGPSASRQ
jgi:two-component sensor histidine kinase